MKYVFCLILWMVMQNGFSRNLGIRAVTLVTKIGIASGNNWGHVNNKENLRGSKNIYRLKIGLATGGGGTDVNQITMIIAGAQLTNKPFPNSAVDEGLPLVRISNSPISMAGGLHTIQFQANYITPSTDTSVKSIYSTILVKPN